MELKTKRVGVGGGGGGGGPHLMTLIIQQPIFSPSRSADSTPRHRTRPKSLFFRQKISPACSEPTSPKVNCAGRVKDRAELKAKGNKKSTLVRSLSLTGSLLVDGAIRCCRSPRGSVTGDSDEEEEGGGDLGRWMERREVENLGGGLVSAPLNALQLMKQRSAPARVGEEEREGVGEGCGDPKRNSF